MGVKMKIVVGDKVVGEVRGDTFHKVVKSSKHFLRKPPAIAFDLASLENAKDAGATKVSVFDTDTKTTYEATIDTILDTGFDVNRGAGRQVGLDLLFWQATPAQ